ncbi:MAG: TRL-like protein family [Planctomycetes bacterium]|nr:TRL-like protein family [Planctomycetota bacterium]MBI3846021.1 TRL-like protein family [Planctomycetota bacterium]
MKTLCVLAVLCLLLTTTGCYTVFSPVAGWIYTDVKWAGPVGDGSGMSKHGSAEAMSVLGLVGVGDCSLEAASRNGGITKIHHADFHSWSILGVFGRLTTTVCGE